MVTILGKSLLHDAVIVIFKIKILMVRAPHAFNSSIREIERSISMRI